MTNERGTLMRQQRRRKKIEFNDVEWEMAIEIVKETFQDETTIILKTRTIIRRTIV